MEKLETPTEIISSGNALQKTASEFTQAITIQKPRQRLEIIKACEEEAAIAGEEFYYSWTVKSKNGRSTLVEGLSIGGAIAAARNWGNCALPCHVEETPEHYLFTAAFVDFETGFNMQRVFKQRKEQNIGMKDTARAEDITFQIGQSKALRNVALNAMPSWLTKKMLDKAKQQVVAAITKMGLPVARQKALDFFEQHGVDIDRVEKKMAKKHSHWNAEDLAIIKGAMSSLINGQESADSLFPAVNEEAAVKTNKNTSDLKEKIAAKTKAKKAKPVKATTKPEPVEEKVPEAEKEEPKAETTEAAPSDEALLREVDEAVEDDPVESESSDPKDDQKEDGLPWKDKMLAYKAEAQMSDEAMAAELTDLGFESLDDVQEKDQVVVEEYIKDNYKLD